MSGTDITNDIHTTERVTPTIYSYPTPEIARHDGWTKIGYTDSVADVVSISRRPIPAYRTGRA